MVFTSPIFLFFFLPLVLAGSWLIHPRLLNTFLLLASVVFYAWGGAEHVPLLIALVVANWLVGLLLEQLEDQERYRLKDLVYFGCIAGNVACLVYFKYVNFIFDNVNLLLSPAGLTLPHMRQLVLPLGISFFTFHLLSYVIDIYRGAAKAQRNPLDFGLYICFFPQLIAGPIIRYHDIEAQLTARRVDLEKFSSGAERFIVGLGKKALLANPFGQMVDQIFALQPADLGTGTAWLGICGYALQLYFDFSGYSDMAIGLGRMFGFEYLENFNYPFISRSIHEFWQRWHISLSNWFRDYFYMPMVVAFARRAQLRNPGVRRKFDDRPQLALVFFVCGIWHGASWNFAIFGILHGLFLVLERGALGRMLKARAIVSHVYVFLVIMIAWVFFRCETLQAALSYLGAMAGFGGAGASDFPIASFADRRILLLLPVALLAITPLFSLITRDWRERAGQAFGQVAVVVQATQDGTLDISLRLLRPLLHAAILVLSAAYIAGQTYNPFLYFRF